VRCRGNLVRVLMRTTLASALLSTNTAPAARSCCCAAAFFAPTLPVPSRGSSSPRCFSSVILRSSSRADDLEALRVPELKDLLRARGLPVSGRKSELIGRLLLEEGGTTDDAGSTNPDAADGALAAAATAASETSLFTSIPPDGIVIEAGKS